MGKNKPAHPRPAVFRGSSRPGVGGQTKLGQGWLAFSATLGGDTSLALPETPTVGLAWVRRAEPCERRFRQLADLAWSAIDETKRAAGASGANP